MKDFDKDGHQQQAKTSIKTLVFPHLHLLVSGGNSQLLRVKSFNDIEIIGQTLDDAAGETFDKIGRMLGIKYPAGVTVARTAGIIADNPLGFPISMQKNKELNFSFSGLKTHVRYLIEKKDFIKYEKELSAKEIKIILEDCDISDSKLKFIKEVCQSTQSVIIKQLISKVVLELKNNKYNSLGLSGGVSANKLLRSEMDKLADKYTPNKLFKPHMSLTGDNAVMIGLAGIAKKY